ncbi:MAG TPA: WD40 repeat domain-containing protein [Streptosporangiaceae bacterium]
MTRDGGHEIRDLSPSALLSVLCAAAFAPLVVVGAGITGAAAVAGIGVLSSVGSGTLAEVLIRTVDRLRPGEQQTSTAEAEKVIARELAEALGKGDTESRELRTEIAAILAEIDAGGTVLRAAVESGNEKVRHDVIAAIAGLGADMGFLIGDLRHAAIGIQRSLDEQGANVRAVIDQVAWQSSEIRVAMEQLDRISRRLTAGRTAPQWLRGCPYRGLAPFAEDDAEIFYGRERLTAELASRLAAQLNRHAILVVTGASGAGKSSLLRAGLLPVLARGMQVEGSHHWPRVAITPTADPIAEFAAHLAALGGPDAAQVRGKLTRHPDEAHIAIRQALLADALRPGRKQAGDEPRLVLIVDQFEQAFTLAGEAERLAFVTALHAAATRSAGPLDHPLAQVIIAVRGDFCDRCAGYPELARALSDGPFVVGPMTESDFRLAITSPAEAAGLEVDAALTGTILADLRAVSGPDAVGMLPLLSQAMLLTWENREDGRLTSHGYARAGGVALAIQSSADAVYDALSRGEQDLARQILRGLTIASPDGRLIRRPVTREELYTRPANADRSQVDTVLEAFAAKRLIVLSGDTVQISHDALIEAWPKLRGWLEEDRASWIIHGQLAQDARDWDGHGRDRSFLYRGSQLAALRQAITTWSASSGHSPVLTGTERSFLRASERDAIRGTRVRQAVAAALVVLVAAALTAAGVAITADRSASHERDLAVAAQLAAESEQLDTTQPVTAALLATAAWRIAPSSDQVRESLLQVLARPERSDITLAGGRNVPPHPGTVSFAPDGGTFATVDEGSIQVWNVATHQQSGAAIGTGDFIQSVTFSPVGTILASGDGLGEVRLWDVATHRQIGPPMTASGNGGLGEDVKGLAFAPDGKTLASAASDGTVRLWDLRTHRQIGTSMTYVSRDATEIEVYEVAFSPDDRTLAAVYQDGTARFWDSATHRQVGSPIATGQPATSPLPTSGIEAAAFGPGGTVLATGGYDGTARLWDIASHRQIGQPIVADRYGVPALAFGRAGGTLVTAGGDGMAHVWNVATRTPAGSLDATAHEALDGVAVSPDGRTLATVSSDGTAQLWELGLFGETDLTGDNTVSGEPAFNASGTVLATGSRTGGPLLWNTSTDRPITQREPDSTHSAANAVAFSPDGRFLATGEADGTTRLWDVATQLQAGSPMKAGRERVNAVAFTPDGRELITGDFDHTVRIWDVAAQRQVGQPMTMDDAVDKAAVSPDGKMLAVGSYLRSAAVVNLAARHTAARLGRPGAASNAVAFSPNGRYIATGSFDNAARLWDTSSYAQIGPPMTTGGDVVAVAFSPDSEFLATASSDGTARVWDVRTQQEIGPALRASSTGDVSGITFSPDGKTLATVGADGTLRLWNVAFPRNLIGAVCAIAGRSLTAQEWQTYIPDKPYQLTCPQPATTPVAGHGN